MTSRPIRTTSQSWKDLYENKIEHHKEAPQHRAGYSVNSSICPSTSYIIARCTAVGTGDLSSPHSQNHFFSEGFSPCSFHCPHVHPDLVLATLHPLPNSWLPWDSDSIFLIGSFPPYKPNSITLPKHYLCSLSKTKIRMFSIWPNCTPWCFAWVVPLPHFSLTNTSSLISSRTPILLHPERDSFFIPEIRQLSLPLEEPFVLSQPLRVSPDMEVFAWVYSSLLSLPEHWILQMPSHSWEWASPPTKPCVWLRCYRSYCRKLSDFQYESNFTRATR